MDFELFKLFSITYLELYLARKQETQQTCKRQELVGKIQSLHNHEICHHVSTYFNLRLKPMV